MNISRFLTASALSSVMLLAPAAMAQTADGAAQAQAQTPATNATSDADRRVDESAAPGDAANGKDVVVTGTRIRVPNGESISPITSVTSAELFDSGRALLGDALNDLPQLRTTLGSQNSITGSLGIRGVNAIDLRGLGTTRTLVLVNGRREVAADIINNRPLVDTNTIPQELISRVDILTGGASSVYGSDAISGVVNFVLKDNFDGLALHAQSGITVPNSDAGNQLLSGVIGKNFGGGRGNIALDAEFSHQSAYSANGRDQYQSANGFVTVGSDPAGSPNGSDGIPDAIFFNDIRSTTISLGGQLGFRQSNALAPCGLDSNPNTAARSAFTCAYLFQPDGTLAAQTGQRVGLGPNGSFIAGNGYSGREGDLLTLSPDVQRYTFNAVGHYDIAPALTPFFEARYSNTKAFGSSSGPFFSQGQTLGDGITVPGLVDVSYSNNAANTVVNREGLRIDNPYLTAQARSIITGQLISSINQGVNPNTGTPYATTAAGAAAKAAALAEVAAGTLRFSLRKNYLDLGIRDERLTRETYKFVGGLRGDLGGDLHYEISANYGQHDEKNTIVSNVNRQRFLLATDTAVNAAGQIVCRAQIDPRYAVTVNTASGTDAQKAAILANDIATCVPVNPFGQGSVSDAARRYLTSDTTANGRATQFVASGSINGDSTKLFELPGGPIGFAIGGEYRRETLRYALDPLTQAGYAFYNAIPTFTSPAFEVKEAFGELRAPLLKDLPLIRELTLNGSGRVSKYKGISKAVYTYSGGGSYRPINDLRFRVDYSRAIRAPYLGELYAPSSQNFATVVDPCAARNLATGTTYRAANCAAAGRPATFDYQYSSSLEIRSGGNPNLTPEQSDSMTAGAVFTPHYIPGLTLSADYYNIRVNKVIASVSAQNILNLCYDSLTLSNPFCGLFQRAGASGGPRGEDPFRVLEGSLLQSSANYAKYVARGLDFDAQYNHRFDFGTLALHGIWTHVIQRDNFTNPAIPGFKDVISQELGDPKDTFNINADLKVKNLTFGYSLRWIGQQYVGPFENYNAVNGQPPQNLDAFQTIRYPSVSYSDARIGYDISNKYNVQVGVNNIGDVLPPLGLTGSGNGAIYDNRGRFMYVAIRAKVF